MDKENLRLRVHPLPSHFCVQVAGQGTVLCVQDSSLGCPGCLNLGNHTFAEVEKKYGARQSHNPFLLRYGWEAGPKQ